MRERGDTCVRWRILCLAGALVALAGCSDSATGEGGEDTLAPQPDALVETEGDVPAPEADPGGAPAPDSEPQPDAGPQPDAQPKPDADPQPDAQPEPDTSPGPDASPEPDAEPDAEPEPEPDVAPEPDLTPEPDAGPDPTGVDPGAPGSWALLETFEDDVVREGRTIPVAAHLPAKEGELSPLVVFTPGFQLESWRYEALAEFVAGHGFVVVRAQPPGGFLDISHVAMSEDISAVIDWALAADGPLANHVDPDGGIVTMGHSLGGKVSTMTAYSDARVTGLFAIDPVNGGNPITGYTADLPDILPEQVQGQAIPMGFVGETVNASGGFQPCAPGDQNFQTFYAAAEGSGAWVTSWDIEGADHMDFVSDVSGCLFCGQCGEGSADEGEVQAITRTLAVAFLRRHVLGEPEQEAWLTGAEVPAGVTVEHAP